MQPRSAPSSSTGTPAGAEVAAVQHAIKQSIIADIIRR